MLTDVRPTGRQEPVLCELCLVQVAHGDPCIQCGRMVCETDGITFGDPNQPVTWYRVCLVCIEKEYDTDELTEVEF